MKNSDRSDDCRVASNLQLAINRHLELLDSVATLTKIVLQMAIDGDQLKIDKELENRKRLISIVSYVQGRIERLVKVIPREIYSRKIKLIIKSWESNSDQKIQDIIKMDEQILEYLNRNRDEIKKNISETYKNKIIHEKYNLTSNKG